jgi:hypothetical protein
MKSCSTASNIASLAQQTRKIFLNTVTIYVKLMLLTTLISVHMNASLQDHKYIHTQYPWGYKWKTGIEVLDFSDNLRDP